TSSNGQLTITIVDDVPVARDDVGGTVTEDAEGDELSAISGDVLKNDEIGADGHQDDDALVQWNVSEALREEIGQYGELTLNPDGTWSFELDNSLPATQALEDGDQKDFALGYTITDGDGDTASAELRFSIRGKDDEGGVIVDPSDDDGAADDSSALVYERDLGSDEGASTTGTFTVEATHGIVSISLNGQVFTVEQ